ncbi:glutamate--cysteine ligase [Streptomyces aidingensis]|uniref:Gamma-glutamyl:cysteine ligase YbdK, ATP-grasp superfamily n=1 Tax=Streptomyces aidingensis TaxID=910347 RepID=A0A1I1PGW3_9ACTN|nr:glutamate--cysteine ligase [Streptomyces aidingensis]SFD08886.1 Gamma-glutamyl:cysteine ligase YbdK, ATP-grasp superfamily [Streptomyces aidingensis]
MGANVSADGFGPADRPRFRAKLARCQAVLERMLDDKCFDRPRDLIGLEVEISLADQRGAPRMVNDRVLSKMATADFQTELGKFTLELNMAPRSLTGRVLDDLAEELRFAIGYAARMGAEFDARPVPVGILPTITEADLRLANLSPVDRYRLLNDQIMGARGELVELRLSGAETLHRTFDSIAPEAACTAVQFHLQVTPDRFADVWNASQAAAAAQVAVGANSPFVFGHELWQESRPPLFLQVTDARPPEMAAQGARPRAWFGERWIDSPRQLFEENLRWFPALLPICDEEDPEAVLAAGGVPELPELVLHNGTVYRWNRPVYGVARGRPHLRVENRVLPTGPTVTDMVANAAFYYGLVRALADQAEPVWHRLPFTAAADSFERACRDGMAAVLLWPRRGRGQAGPAEVPAAELVLDELLPLAAAGLDAWGVSAADRDRFLSVVEARCRRRITGAAWQTRTYHRAVDRGADRRTALSELVRRYCELAAAGEPVHDWPPAG